MAIIDRTDRPADQEPRVEVGDRREIELPAAADHKLGRVANPPLVRRVRDEVLHEHIRRDGLVRIAHRRALEAFPHPRREAFHLFQPNHALPTDPVALVPVNAGTAVGAATRFMRGPNQHAELPIPLGVRRLGQVKLPRDAANRLTFLKHQPHRSRLEHLCEPTPGRSRLRCVCHRGHRIRLSERVHETGLSPARLSHKNWLNPGGRSVEALPWFVLGGFVCREASLLSAL